MNPSYSRFLRNYANIPDALNRDIPEHLANIFARAAYTRRDLTYCRWMLENWEQFPPMIRGNTNRGAAIILIEEALLKVQENLPYVVCKACACFDAPGKCYCRGTGWLSQVEYDRLMLEHPDYGQRFFDGPYRRRRRPEPIKHTRNGCGIGEESRLARRMGREASKATGQLPPGNLQGGDVQGDQRLDEVPVGAAASGPGGE